MQTANRFLYLKGPASHQEVPSHDEPASEKLLQQEAVERPRMKEVKEFAEGTTDVILAMETGDTEGAAMAFYKTYLESADKMKRYTTVMMISTMPLLAVLQKVPIFGSLVKLQVAFKDKAIDKLYGTMKKIQNSLENKEAVQLLKKAQGHWEQLSDDEKALVSEMLKKVTK